jgi:hypothetical protein
MVLDREHEYAVKELILIHLFSLEYFLELLTVTLWATYIFYFF